MFVKLHINRKTITSWFYPPGHPVWLALGDAESVTVVPVRCIENSYGRAYLLPQGGWIMHYQARVENTLSQRKAEELEALFA